MGNQKVWLLAIVIPYTKVLLNNFSIRRSFLGQQNFHCNWIVTLTDRVVQQAFSHVPCLSFRISYQFSQPRRHFLSKPYMWVNIYKISLRLTNFVCPRHYDITSWKTSYVFAVSESSYRQTRSMLTLVLHHMCRMQRRGGGCWMRPNDFFS